MCILCLVSKWLPFELSFYRFYRARKKKIKRFRSFSVLCAWLLFFICICILMVARWKWVVNAGWECFWFPRFLTVRNMPVDQLFFYLFIHSFTIFLFFCCPSSLSQGDKYLVPCSFLISYWNHFQVGHEKFFILIAFPLSLSFYSLFYWWHSLALVTYCRWEMFLPISLHTWDYNR